MLIKRLDALTGYDAPQHFGMSAFRVHGFDEEASRLKIGLSHFLPGGGAERSASPVERVYVVLSGHVTVRTDGSEAVLGPLDSCYIGPGEMREVLNDSKLPASMLVVMTKP